MKTIYVVMEGSWRGNTISKVFSDKTKAKMYLDSLCDEFYDFDSAYKYWIEEWEVK